MENQSKLYSTLGIIFAGVSLLLLPPFFGVAALVLGIIATVKKESLGVLALVLGIVLPITGAVLGALVWSNL